MFDIAADVERYPDFLRWWIAVRVRDAGPDGYCTDQVLGLGPLRIRFASETRLARPSRIEVVSNDPAFRHFSLSWAFDPQSGGGCCASLSVELELRSRLLQAIIEGVVPDTAGETMAAFEVRARQLYGAPESEAG